MSGECATGCLYSFATSSHRPKWGTVVLRKREDYDWGPQAIDHSGPASLDGITFKVVKEAALRGSALEAGQADIVLNIQPQEIEGLRAKGFTVAAPASLGFVSGFRVNTKAKFFDDVAVRRAIRNGINRQEILDTVLTEDWKPAISYIEANVPGVADFSALLGHDPEGVKAGLEAAGWLPGPDGIRTKDGERLSFNFYASPWVSTSRPVDELIVQQLRPLGIEANLQVVDVPTFNARVDVLLAIPNFLLAVVIVSSFGFETLNVAIATGVSSVATFARLMRSEVLRTNTAVFVEASGLLGGSRLHVLFRHVLPNAYRWILALAVL